MRQRQTVWLFTVVILLGISMPGRAWSRTAAMQKPCANCHIMHMSQDSQPITGSLGNTERQEGLMNDTCVGCHTNTNVSLQDGSKPYVYTTVNPSPYDPFAAATHTTLAGGNFHWVAAGNDLRGHNVAGIAAFSGTPPGDLSSGKTFDGNTPLTCAGVNGCHGNGAGTQVESIWGSHHSNEPIDGSSPARSYRMLYGIAAGVQGVEDPDWEYTLSVTDHNRYKGGIRLSDVLWDEAYISSSCARCHSNFHNDDNGGTGTDDAGFPSPWIRHPIDIDIGGKGSEYAYGGGGPTAAYQVQTPLASENFDLSPDTVDLSGPNGQGVISCISCHRAHGSPNDYSLRWDYQNWPGPTGYNGCGDCHTTKD
jgi:predicted CXXCH cytochrome family protein